MSTYIIFTFYIIHRLQYLWFALPHSYFLSFSRPNHCRFHIRIGSCEFRAHTKRKRTEIIFHPFAILHSKRQRTDSWDNYGSSISFCLFLFRCAFFCLRSIFNRIIWHFVSKKNETKEKRMSATLFGCRSSFSGCDLSTRTKCQQMLSPLQKRQESKCRVIECASEEWTCEKPKAYENELVFFLFHFPLFNLTWKRSVTKWNSTPVCCDTEHSIWAIIIKVTPAPKPIFELILCRSLRIVRFISPWVVN